MNFKTFGKSNTAFVLKNIALAGLIGIAILVAVVVWHKKLTRHGDEVVVPQITGLYVEEAEILAQNQDLHIHVIDSTYSRSVPLGTIVEQNPRPESHAKRGRTVYVIVNAKTVRQIPVPDLHDVSCRQAEATLRALGLEVAEIEYEPSEYKDLVLEMKYNGQPIAAGQRISEGTALTLVVGFGTGTENVEVPALTGMSLADVRATLLANRLILGSVEYDIEPTDDNRQQYVVYGQSVSAGSQILEGSRVDIRLTTDLLKVATTATVQSEEEFF